MPYFVCLAGGVGLPRKKTIAVYNYRRLQIKINVKYLPDCILGQQPGLGGCQGGGSLDVGL